MKRITEKLCGKQSIFIVEEIVSDVLISSKTITVNAVYITHHDKLWYLLYNSKGEIITDAYNYLNHNGKDLSSNSLKANLYALRFLYAFSEIFEKDISLFDKQDFLRLRQFLSGVSVDNSTMQLSLLTERTARTVDTICSAYREFFRYLELDDIALNVGAKKYHSCKTYKQRIDNVPKYISVDEYKKIITYIRSMSDKCRRLRDECIVRLMFEGGCRLGEVLGATIEDFELKEINGNEMCFMYIRNRYSDRIDQHAKTVMNIVSKDVYKSSEYRTKDVGYQVTYLNLDLSDKIDDYIDLAHDKAYKKYRKNYDDACADTVKSKTKGKNYYVFLNLRGQPLTSEGWNQELRKIFKACDIPVDVNTRQNNLSHRFRHGFVMHLIYDLQTPRELVMQRSRHRTYEGLNAYYNPTVEQLIKYKNEIEKNILNGCEDN